ncbi:mitochondrial import inner membrane translocase subunit Tim16-like [Lepeophtheirus salmonis]|nr:mitochondrial import inner membrane translocase subunit Tim16-like [Lepeophtheirus salmonis]XP_040582435.1 mitochondrial import inner membrane translocase subunit Tim16-like [Lepeophtheirus salmonis]
MAKQLAQLVIAGLQVVGKAFTKAVREEVRLSQEAAKRHSSNTKDQTAHATENMRLGMTLDEAKQILDVDSLQDLETFEKKYQHLFEVNDKSKGGSFYLQSKVVRAKERIDQEIHLESNKQGPDSK